MKFQIILSLLAVISVVSFASVVNAQSQPVVNIVKNINQAGVPPSDATDVSDIVLMNGIMYFMHQNATYGAELWKSDGTVTGTSLVKDIHPGANGSNPTNITVVNTSSGNRLFFCS